MHVIKSQGFGKGERLTHRKDIQELFIKGSSFYIAPLRFRYLPGSGQNHRVVISVPKRIFRKAVDRNLIKRRIREAYRKNKHLLEEQPAYHIAFIITQASGIAQDVIDSAMVKGLKRLAKFSLADGSDS